MTERDCSESDPLFLTVDQVLVLHQRQLERDRGLLESAVAQPEASFGGAFAHDGLLAMAAAYLFHIASNHPFVDGNKRAGLLASLTFLSLNGVRILGHSEALYTMTMGVAEGRLDKAAVAAELERIAKLHG